MEFVLIGLVGYMLYRIGRTNHQHQTRLNGYQPKPSSDPIKPPPRKP